jgi:hypothetical protein
VQQASRVQLGHLRAVSIKKTLSTVTQAARKMCSEMNVSVGGGGSAGQGRAGQRAVWRLGSRVMIVFSPRELGVHGRMLGAAPNTMLSGSADNASVPRYALSACWRYFRDCGGHMMLVLYQMSSQLDKELDKVRDLCIMRGDNGSY